MLRVVGQVGATYIVAEGPQGLYLIDQHAAHERILYEQFMTERADEVVHSQELLEPLAVELLPEQMATVEEALDMLEEAKDWVLTGPAVGIIINAIKALEGANDPGNQGTAGETVCYEIFREIIRQSRQFEFDEVMVLANQDVIELLLDEQARSLAELEEQTGKSIRLQTEALYLQDQFDVVLM